MEKKATIENLLTARSGVYHDSSTSYGKNQPPKPERGSHEADTYWYYNNWDFNVAGTIFEQETKINIYDALYNLGKKIGFDDYNYEDVEKHKINKNEYISDISNHKPYHFNLSARDMSKIGLLMLNKGKYNEEQIISEKWVKKITSLVTPYEEAFRTDITNTTLLGYGYLWWIYDTNNNDDPLYGSYCAQGVGQESIIVIPKLNIIIITKGIIDTKKGPDRHFVTRLIISAYQ